MLLSMIIRRERENSTPKSTKMCRSLSSVCQVCSERRSRSMTYLRSLRCRIRSMSTMTQGDIKIARCPCASRMMELHLLIAIVDPWIVETLWISLMNASLYKSKTIIIETWIRAIFRRTQGSTREHSCWQKGEGRGRRLDRSWERTLLSNLTLWIIVTSASLLR